MLPYFHYLLLVRDSWLQLQLHFSRRMFIHRGGIFERLDTANHVVFSKRAQQPPDVEVIVSHIPSKPRTSPIIGPELDKLIDYHLWTTDLVI